MPGEFSKSTLSEQNLKWGMEVNKYRLIYKKKFVSGIVSGNTHNFRPSQSVVQYPGGKCSKVLVKKVQTFLLLFHSDLKAHVCRSFSVGLCPILHTTIWCGIVCLSSGRHKTFTNVAIKNPYLLQN